MKLLLTFLLLLTTSVAFAQGSFKNLYGLSRTDLKDYFDSRKDIERVFTGDYYMLTYALKDSITISFHFNKDEICVAGGYIIPATELDHIKRLLGSNYPNSNLERLKWWDDVEMVELMLGESETWITLIYIMR